MAAACYDGAVQVFDRADPWSGRVLAAVAGGGAVGASARWAVFATFDRAALETDWPWALLAVNVFGALAIGVGAARLDRDSVAWSFVATGLLGGFTTVSLLAVELNDLAERDRLWFAVVYAAVTVMAGWAAVWTGERVGRGRRSDEVFGDAGTETDR